MDKAELLKQAKPILFNTAMVQAILDGRKTQTRRVLKAPMYVPNDAEFGYTIFTPEGHISVRGWFENGYGEYFIKLPYKKGDILYVREKCWKNTDGQYRYLADYVVPELMEIAVRRVDKIRPSIHMSKEAARIFLKVKDVRIERLQEIKYFDFLAEGLPYNQFESNLENDFAELWNSTITKSALPYYGWEANPYVWVYEFERVIECT